MLHLTLDNTNTFLQLTSDGAEQQTLWPTVAVRNHIELLLYSFLGINFQCERGLQMANEVTMPTNDPILNSEDVDGL